MKSALKTSPTVSPSKPSLIRPKLNINISIGRSSENNVVELKPECSAQSPPLKPNVKIELKPAPKESPKVETAKKVRT